MNEDYKIEHKVKLKMREDGCAVMTTGWRKIVRKTEMREGQMAVFCFDLDDDGLFVSLTNGLPMEDYKPSP